MRTGFHYEKNEKSGDKRDDCYSSVFAALFVISSLLNKGNTDMTTEMAKATYPVVAVNYGDSD